MSFSTKRASTETPVGASTYRTMPFRRKSSKTIVFIVATVFWLIPLEPLENNSGVFQWIGPRFDVSFIGEDQEVSASQESLQQQWIQPTPRPLPRSGHAVVYDSFSGRALIFGGLTAGGLSNETWTYHAASSAWRQWMSLLSPSPREGHAMAYASDAGLVVLFGGRTETGLNNETWVLDLTSYTWTRREPPSAPTPRERHEMTYDVRSKRIVLFGGWTGENNGETWIYDATNDSWAQVVSAPSPSARHDHSMAYEARAGLVALFGGAVGDAFNQTLSSETWSFDPLTNVWINLTVPRSPSPRDRHAMVYDSRADRIVLFGGSGLTGLSGDVWFFDLANDKWVSLNTSVQPTPRDDHALAYDEQLDRVVLIGGRTTSSLSDEIWLLDPSSLAWSNPLPVPSLRSGHCMVYVPGLGRSILFGGGTGGGLSNETWTYDVGGNLWTSLNPTRAPSSRGWFAMAYDSRLDRVVVFGGAFLNVPPYDNNETWAYDPASNTWINLTRPIGPGPREGHAMAYDGRAGRFVLFGGFVWGGPSPSNETWIYDLANNTWTAKSPVNAPAGRFGHAMVYDAGLNRVVMFGGTTATGATSETWAYDLLSNTWTMLAGSVAPSPRSGSSMVYDSASGRILLYGGDRPVSPRLSSETWFYYSQNNTWIDASPRALPPPRTDQALVYDSRVNVAVLFAGFTQNLEGDDLWWYGSFGPPSAPQDLLATPGSGRVALAWKQPADNGGAPIIGYRIYRGTISTNLSGVAEVDNQLTYVDSGLVNGETYRYRLTAINAAGEGSPSVEVEVVPVAATDFLYLLLLWSVGVVAATVVLVGLIIGRRKRRQNVRRNPPKPNL